MSTTATPPKPARMRVQPDAIPPEVRDQPRWLRWRWTKKKNKWTKPPYSPSDVICNKTDPANWTDFESALHDVLAGRFDGVGFELTDDGIVGVDLDDCRDPETGEISEPAASIIHKMNTYTEISPSGTGVKMLCRANVKTKVNHAIGVEVHGDGTYYCLTGHRLPEAPASIEERQDGIDWLLETYVSHRGEPRRNGQATDDIGTARDALAALSPSRADAYDDWLRVGMALHSVSDTLLDDWDKWSRQSDKFSDGACTEKWGSFRGNGIGIGSLVQWAKDDTGWKPPRASNNGQGKSSEPQGDATSSISNATWTTNDDQTATKVPRRMADILQDIDQQTGHWPRRVDRALFVQDDHGIAWLDKPAALFGWISSKVGQVKWYDGPGCVLRAEVHAELQRTTRRYGSVEELPHEPMVEGHYYTCGPVTPGKGDALRELVGRFYPETDVDHDLITAALVTPAWGGPCGARPTFVITSDAGRGSGKSTLAKMTGRVWGGELSFSHLEDISKIKTRLLSAEALPKRVCLLDNLKSLRFSWAELEAMVTSATIGGHRMYVGEATRPNTLTWLITLNGASLSTDMAQRAVIVKLKKPRRSGSWEEDTARYIDDHREEIIADCIGILRREPTPLAKFTRWGAWEKDVLQRLPDPAEAQKVILERQDIADAEGEEADIVQDFFRGQLADLHYDVDRDQVFIPSATATRWYNWGTNDRAKAAAVSRILGQLIDEDRLPSLRRNKCGTWGRGFVWIGANADLETSVQTDVNDRLAMRMNKKDV